MASRKANANIVYQNASSSRQGGQTSRASGPQNVDHSLSHEPEAEHSMGATDNLDSLISKTIGKLSFEAGLDVDFFHLPSFNELVNLLTRGVQIAMPSYEYILQVQLTEVRKHEKTMRQHWERIGCSLILDSWKSQCGRSFISAFVHCRKGMLFLRSIDISTIYDDVDELALLICSLVEDIGSHNIVQVISNCVSPHMQAAEHAVVKKYDKSFLFSVCADHCINLLLEDIAELDHVKDVLTKAREITLFLYGHALPMELMKKVYYFDSEIISNSNLKSVAKFLTLETLVSQRKNMLEMFSSADWVSSDLAGTNLSMHICEVVQTDSAFWNAANNVLKLTGPLISVLYKLETDNCPVSVLYDAMDNTKEDIKKNLGHEHGSYWDMIDYIWDNYLHSPIHAAGYILNPGLSYTDRFGHDAEISSGITTCILQASKSHYDALHVAEQMDLYQRKSGLFASDTAIEEATATPQDVWWEKHGSGTKALQSFAARILGQACFGVTRYNLDKSFSERLHTEKRSFADQERFRNKEYIYYNLRLMKAVPCLKGPPAAQHGKVTAQLSDWVSA